MTSIRSLALLLILLSLVGCEQAASPAVQPKAAAQQEQPDKPSAAKVQPAPSNSVAKPEPEAAPKQQKPAPAKPSAPQAKAKPAAAPEGKAPLDLSLHPDVFDPLQPLVPLDDLPTPLLPPLFVERVAPESPFQLNGKLITNEGVDDYWQSVEGAQLQFEFKQ